MRDERLSDDLSNAPAWVDRPERVLVHHLQIAPRMSELAATQLHEVDTLEPYFSGECSRGHHDGVREGRLACASLANDAKGLGTMNLEGDVGDRMHHSRLQATETAGWKFLDEVPDLEEGIAIACRRRSSHCAVLSPRPYAPCSSTGWKQAQWWPGSCSSISGISSLQRSPTDGHRGANAQPDDNWERS